MAKYGIVWGSAAAALWYAGSVAGSSVARQTSGSSIAIPKNLGVTNPAPLTPNWATMLKPAIPAWSDWKAMCGNGVCDEGEWCRNCPKDCPCTVNCGNGICDDGENGDTCPKDCSHTNAVCGDGKCENVASQSWVNKYESNITCPVDCAPVEVCGNGKCESTESCFTCPGDCGVCPTFCGDERCDSTESCSTCPRDCGLCPVKDKDGLCAWPRESHLAADCAQAVPMKSVVFEGVSYAVILNTSSTAAVPSSCNTASTTVRYVPRGWKVASYNDRARRFLLDSNNQFGAECAVFDDGFALPIGGPGTGRDCFTAPLYEVVQNGTVMGFRDNKDRCFHAILLEKITEAVAAADKNAAYKVACPGDCYGRGKCNTLSGVCQCDAPWTGMYCQRQIGDLGFPSLEGASWYRPQKGITWNWELEFTETSSAPVALYDVDLYLAKDKVQELKAEGKKIMCYFSAGSTENFRVDNFLFPADVQGGTLTFGTGDTFSGEKWLDLRRLDKFASLMLRRIEDAKRLGCDAIEFDNPDVVIHDSKFANGGKNTLDQCIIYAKWLTAHAHSLGMGTALKNSNEFAVFLKNTHDMVVNEECWINGNCDNYWPFLQQNKPVLNTEYFTTRCFYCDRSLKINFSTIKKVPNLDGCVADCKSLGGQPINRAVCDKAGYLAGYAYPKKENWCQLTTNTDANECPAARFATCNPANGY